MNNNEPVRIVFTGGGSGGHIYPIIAVAEALKNRLTESNIVFSYIGPSDVYSNLLIDKGVTIYPIAAGKVRRYASIDNMLDIPKFFIGFLQALFHLYLIMPDVVFSKGGPGAFPVVLAAWFYRIPVAIHDSDAIPGKNNIASARFAQKIFVGFSKAKNYFSADKTEITGIPLRTELTGERTTKEAAKEIMGFDKSQPLTVVIGGSQGATRINDFVIGNLPQFLADTQVLHQTGTANIVDIQKLSEAALRNDPASQESSAHRYIPVAYLGNDMSVALTAADLVVARSGSSVFEFAAFGLPAILIPLAESANDHQRANAYEFAKSGAGIVIEEANLLPGIFFAQLKKILSDDGLRAQMSAASSAFFIPGAAEKIADGLLTFIKK